ncbi:hypothetical protein Q4595_19040, partial [Wenyingzhuangia sp. 1_MG-2023]|nr:hypothetical protein [Wenyingzhuangia sp. 1_MG-2023]
AATRLKIEGLIRQSYRQTTGQFQLTLLANQIRYIHTLALQQPTEQASNGPGSYDQYFHRHPNNRLFHHISSHYTGPLPRHQQRPNRLALAIK